MRRMLGTVLIGVLVLILAAHHPSGRIAAQQTDPVALVAGCNNVTLTWPVGTPLATVAEGVAPSSALLSIFRLDPMMGRFLGYAPGVPDFANDYRMVGTSLEPVFICVSAAGTLNRPALGASPAATPSPSSPPAAVAAAINRAPPLGPIECPLSHPIKGNQSSSGERIYHVPGGASYAQTEAEECFATEEDAQRAGYRRALR